MKVNLQSRLRVEKAIDRLRRSGVEMQPITRPPWIEDVEAKIGGTLPEMYRFLVTRYSFPVIDLGPIELFSNLGNESIDDVTHAPFRDPILSHWLTRHGYFHFSRLTTDNYDPICFDIRGTPKKALSVFRFDHESILQGQATVPRVEFPDSFLALLEGDMPTSPRSRPKPPKK